MVEYLLKAQENAKEVANYHAEQYNRAVIKLEVINEMLEEAKRAETATVERYADGELVETETVEETNETEV